jgi:2-polyprenyl-3-methyl-5-hydroxy-6-metoxy-1,4-benzoquinol methylase
MTGKLLNNMIQKISDLENWHSKEDPWGYFNNDDDKKRKEILLKEIPNKSYKNVLDIGCGQGFVTNDLPGENIIGVDISKNAIDFANLHLTDHVKYEVGSIFEIDKLFDKKFDLIVITGVLYSQYIGDSNSLIYLLLDRILEKNGILISVHINDWYNSQFPYYKIKQVFYDYREYVHNLEIYVK